MTYRLTLCVLLLIGATACEEQPRIEVGGQAIYGTATDTPGVAAFLGIPFASPPVGDLRWRAPRPFVPDSESIDAFEFAPACMQSMRILDWYRDMAEIAGADRSVMSDLEISEDCLHLNVWTTATGVDAGLPIMVYVHGGSNRSGWSYEPNYFGHNLAAKGVVVFSVAYRLGDFGFFAHPDLDDGEAVANFGLWDLVAALEWIQAHAPQFGGDPDRVTLFGESSGAEDIAALMYSGIADDLFHGAILQSTAGFSREGVADLQEERQRGLRLAENLGDTAALSVDEMRAIPAAKFLELAELNRNDYYHSPVADGTFLDRQHRDRTDDSASNYRPTIVGTNLNESYSRVRNTTVRDEATRIFGDDADAAIGAVASESDPRKALDRIRTSADFLCPAQEFAAELAAGGSPVWMYQFSRVRQDAIGEAAGAYHGAELPYVFGTHDHWFNTTADDLQITKDTMSYWVALATAGNPNSAATENWPQYAGPDYRVQDINTRTTSIERPEAELCRLFRKRRQQQE